MSDFQLCYVEEEDTPTKPSDAKTSAAAATTASSTFAAAPAASAVAASASAPTPAPPAAPAPASASTPAAPASSAAAPASGAAKRRRNLTPADVTGYHQAECVYLTKALAEARSASPPLPCVIFTHHSPYASSPMRGLFGKGLSVWAYGHTHFSDYEVHNGTSVVSNQCGYIAMGDLKRSRFVPEVVLRVFADGSSDVQYSDSAREREAAARKAESDAYAASLGPPPEAPPAPDVL
jgi:hypothetical protein